MKKWGESSLSNFNLQSTPLWLYCDLLSHLNWAALSSEVQRNERHNELVYPENGFHILKREEIEKFGEIKKLKS
ncbi:MAG: hypothetical protein AYK19_05080 [Theionarchaea archaeon DG-70-1]|nr:MAG: hypothetical protein AYK19_05080 [Theionarchaea archaeon DG-70-1]